MNGAPNGTRTRVSALRGPCPRPLDDGSSFRKRARLATRIGSCQPEGRFGRSPAGSLHFCRNGIALGCRESSTRALKRRFVAAVTCVVQGIQEFYRSRSLRIGSRLRRLLPMKDAAREFWHACCSCMVLAGRSGKICGDTDHPAGRLRWHVDTTQGRAASR